MNSNFISVQFRPFSRIPSPSSSLLGHNGTIRVIKFQGQVGRNQTVLASAGAGDCAVRLWDINSGAYYLKNLFLIKSYFDSIITIILCTIKIESCLHSFGGHEAHVHGLSWLDTWTCVSGCEKGWLICHDMRSPQYAWKASIMHANHQGICTLASLKSSTELVAGLTGGAVCIFSSSQQRFVMAPVKVHDDDVRHVTTWERSKVGKGGMFDSDMFVLTTSFDGTGAVWNLSTSSEEYKMQKIDSLQNGHIDKILCAIRCPQSGRIFTTGADGRTVLWD